MVMLVASADILSSAIDPTLVILLSPKLTFPEKVPPEEALTTSATSKDLNA